MKAKTWAVVIWSATVAAVVVFGVAHTFFLWAPVVALTAIYVIKRKK